MIEPVTSIEQERDPVQPIHSGLRTSRRFFGWIIRLALILVVFGLLYIALRRAPVRDILQALSALRLWQILVLLSLDGLIYALVTARWWFVVRAERVDLSLIPLIGVRLSVFAISYFTLGPQIGGEPLQVLFLRRKYGLTYTRATASVLMDKLLELLGNFILLGFGLVAIFESGLLSTAGGLSSLALFALIPLVSWPLVHIMLLRRHVYPIGGLLRLFGLRHSGHKLPRFISASEYLAGRFCQRQPGLMFGAAATSLLAAAATVSEYALMASFLHIDLPFWQLVTAWTAGWLSFLFPLPGGLGALEASQVSVLGSFGVSGAAAIGIALVMRGRDLMLGGLGLVLAGNAARKNLDPKLVGESYS